MIDKKMREVKYALWIFFLSAPIILTSETKYWTGSVNSRWSRLLNWNPWGAPLITDPVIIQSGLTRYPYVDGDGDCQSLTIESGAGCTLRVADADLRCDGDVNIKSGGGLVISNACSLLVTGTWVDSGSFTHTGGWVVFVGSNCQCYKETFYNLIIRPRGAITSAVLQLAPSETIKVTNSFLIESGATFYGGNGSVFITYSWTNNGTFDCQTGKVVLKTPNVPVETYYDLEIDTNCTLQGDITVKHNLKINSGRTLNVGSYTIYVEGDFINEGTFNGGTGKVVFNGTGNQSVKMTNGSFNDFEVNKSTGVLTAITPLDIDGNFTITLGTFEPGNFTHTVAGNWSDAGGTFQPTSGRIILDGTSQTITQASSNNFYELEISGASVTCNSGITVTKEFILTSGTFDPSVYTHYIAGNWDDVNVTFTPNAGKIILNGDTITITCGAGNNFNNLTLNCDTVTILSDLEILGDLELQGKVDAQNYTIRVGGDYTEVSGYLKSNGTFIFTGNKTRQDITTQSASEFDTLKIEVNPSDTVRFLSGIKVTGSFVMDSGVIVPGSYTHYITGNWVDTNVTFVTNVGKIVLEGNNIGIWTASTNEFNSLTINVTGTATLYSNVKLNGDFTLQAGTFNLNGDTITCSGSWSDAGGTFQASSGCVILNGNSATVTTGTGNYFYDLTISTTNRVNATTDLDIRGDLRINSGGLHLGDGLTHKVGGKLITNDSLNLGTSKLKVTDSLKVLTYGVLYMKDDCVLELLGKCIINGRFDATGATPVITSDSSSYFGFKVLGTVYIKHLDIYGVDSEGIYVDSTATIVDIANITFTNTDTMGHPSYCLQILRNADYTDEFTGLYFYSTCTDSNKIRNVRAEGGTYTVNLTISDYGGEIGGEDYDCDPTNGWVYWRFKKTWIGKEDSLWSNPANWEPYGLPADTEDIIIPDLGKPDTFYPILDMDDTIAALVIDSGARLRVDTFGTYLLVINGNLRCNGEFDPGYSTVEFGGLASQIALGHMGTFYNLRINKGSGTIVASDSMVIKHHFILKSGTFDPGPFNHHIGGDWEEEGGTFQPTSGTIVFDGSAGELISQLPGNWFNNVKIKKTGILTLKTDMNIHGDLIVEKGQLLPDTFDINLKGDWDSRGGIFQATGGYVKFCGTYQTIHVDTQDYFNDIIVNAVDSVKALDSLIIKGNLSLSGGKFSPGNFNHRIYGNFNAVGGIFQPSVGQIIFADSSLVNIDDDWFNDVKITGALVAQSNITIKGDLDIDGRFYTGNYTHTIYGNWNDVDGVFQPTTGTIILNGNGKTISQNISNNFYNLTISGNITASSRVNVKGDFTISGTFNPGSFTHYIEGNFNAQGGTFTPTSGKIVFSGSSQEIRLGTGNNFYNLEIASLDSTIAKDSLDINGDMLILQGKFVPGTFTHRVAGNFVDTTGVFRAVTGKIVLDGAKQEIYQGINNYFNELVVNVSDTLWARTNIHTASSFYLKSGVFIPGNYTHTIEGTWIDTGGVFQPTGGTIIVKGLEIYQGNNNNFYNLTTDGTNVTAKTNLDIDGTLIVNSGEFNLGTGLIHDISGSPGVYGVLDLGTSVLTFDGTMNIYNGGIVEMTNTCTLKVGNAINITSGGKLYATISEAVIIAKDTTAPYEFDVHGELDVSGLTISYVDTGGVCIEADAIITKFDNVKLCNQRGSGRRIYIQVYRNTDYEKTFTHIEFDEYCDTNVFCDGGGNTVNLFMCACTGPKAGEDYDYETNGANIKWTNANVWTGEATWAFRPDPRWSSTANWSLGRPPADTETVLIPVLTNGNYPELDMDDTCKILIIESNAKMYMNRAGFDLWVAGSGAKIEIQGELTISQASCTLNVGGDWVNTGTFSHYAGWVCFDSVGKIQGNTVFKNLSIHGANANVTLNAGDTITVTDTFVIDNVNAVFNGGDGAVFRTASWNNQGTFNAQTGTVELIANMTCPDETFYNLTISAKDSLGTDLICQKNLWISTNDTLLAKGYTVYVGGHFVNYGTFEHGNNKVVFNGSGAQYFYPGTSPFYDIEINKSSGVVVDTLLGVDIDGDFHIINGEFSPRTYTIHVAGDWIDTGGVFQPNGGDIVFDGNKQNIYTGATNYFYNLTIETQDTIWWRTSIDVNNGLYLNKGVIIPFGFTHYIGCDWADTQVVFKQDSGAIIFDGKGISINQANTNYFYNLIIQVDDTVKAQSNINIYGNFELVNGVFEPGAYTHYVKGNWVDTGGVFQPNEGTIIFDGDSTRIFAGSDNNFFNVKINVQDTAYAMTELDINGDFVLTNGVFAPGNFTHTIAGEWNDTAGVFNPDIGTIEFDGEAAKIYSDTTKNAFNFLTIKSGNTYLCTDAKVKKNFTVQGGAFNSGPYILKVGGNINAISGTLACDSGCVYLFGSASSIIQVDAGDYFNDLTIDKTATVTGESDISIRGDFTLVGGVFDPQSYTITCYGNWDDSGGEFKPTAGKVVFTNVTSTIKQGAGNRFFNVDFTPYANDTIKALSPLVIYGDVNIETGWFDPGNYVDTVKGNWKADWGKFNPQAGEIVFAGSTQTIIENPNNAFNNLTVNVINTLTPQTSTKIKGKLRVNSGELNLSTGIHTCEDSILILGRTKVSGSASLRSSKWVKTHGTLELAGGNLLLTRGFELAQSGSLIVSNDALIDHFDVDSNYQFNLYGIVDINGLIFKHADTFGMYIDSLAEIVQLNNVEFDSVKTGGTHLYILRNDTFVMNFSGCSFDATCDVNIHADGGGDSTYIKVTNYSGDKAGEAYDEEVNNAHIVWIFQRTWTGSVDSLWSNPNNWNPIGIPCDTEDVLIPSSITTYPVLDTEGYCYSIVIEDTLNLKDRTLYVKGDLVCNGKIIPSSGEVVFNGSSNQTISGSILSPITFNNFVINKSAGTVLCNHALDINGDVHINNGEFNPGGYIHYVGGDWVDTGGIFHATSGEIRFDGDSATILTGNGNYFGSIRIQCPILARSRLDVNGDMRIESRFYPDTFTHTVAGNWNDYLGVFQPSGGKIVMDGDAVTLYTNASNYFNDLEINVTTSCEAYKPLNIHGDLVINSGEFIPGDYTHYIRGDWVDTGGVFNASQGKIIFNGNGTILQKSTNYFHSVEIATSDSVSAGSNLQIHGKFVISSGKFKPGGYTHTIRDTFDASGGVFQPTSGTIVMEGGSPTIKLGLGNNFYNLTIEVTGTALALDSFDINGSLTLLSGTFNPDSFTHRVAGNWNTAGGTFTPVKGKIILDGGKSTINLGNGNSFNELILAKTDSLKALASIDVNGDFIIWNGIFYSGDYTHYIGGNWVDTGGTFVATAGKIVFDGSSQSIRTASSNKFYTVEISSQDSVYALTDITTEGDFIISQNKFSPIGHDVTVKGNWNDTAGVFQPASGKVILTGNSNIYQSQDNYFNELVIETQGEVTTQANINVNSKLRINKGELNLGTELYHVVKDSIIVDSILDLGTSVLRGEGHIYVGAEGLLYMSGACTLKVGNDLYIDGKLYAGGLTPTITDTGNYFGFTVKGQIEVNALNLNRVNSTGLYIDSSAVIIKLDNINFTNIETGGTFLQVLRDSDYVATYSGHSYDNSCTYNFHLLCNDVDSAIVTMVAYTGDKAGADYDTTTQYARIIWTPGKLWLGAENDLWDNPNNWQGGVPGSGDQAIIQDAPYDPTINVDTSCAALIVQDGAVVNLSVDGSVLRVRGDININAGGAINLTANTELHCEGTWTNNGTFQQTNGSVVFTGPTCITNSETFKTMIIDNNDTVTLASDVVVTVTDSFVIRSGGCFKGGNNAVFKTSSWYNYGRFIPQTGTVVLQAKMEQPEDTFYNLTIAGDTCKLLRNLTCLNDLTIQSGCVLEATDDTIFIHGDWNNAGVFDAGNSTVIFKGSGAQTISASKFYNLVIANTSTKGHKDSGKSGKKKGLLKSLFRKKGNEISVGNRVGSKENKRDTLSKQTGVIVQGALDIDGDFIILEGEFDPGDYTHYVSGDWIDTGGVFNPSYGTIVLDGTNQTILQGVANYFNNLTVAGNLTLDYGTVKIKGNLIVNSGATLTIDSLAILKLGGNSNKMLGTFIAQGLAPLITSINPGVTYYNLRLKGNVNISRLWVEYIGGDGLVIDTTANIINLNNIYFSNINGTGLTIYRNAPYSDTLSNLSFDATCTYNIHADGSGVNIFVEDYMGAHSGEAYDYETNGAIVSWKDSSYIDINWTYPSQRKFTGGIVASIARRSTDGNLFVSTESESVIALTAAGSRIWAKKITGYAKTFILIRGDTLYVPTTSGTLYAMDASNGNVLWKFGVSDSIIGGVIFDNNLLYFGSVNDTVYAVDLSGVVQWRTATHGAVRPTPTITFHKWLHIGSDDDTLYKLYTTTGNDSAKFATSGDVRSSVFAKWIASNYVHLYFGGMDGNLYSVDSAEAQPAYNLRWNYAANGAIEVMPWLRDDKVYFCDTLGNLYCADTAGNANPWSWTTHPVNFGSPIRTWPIVYNNVIYFGCDNGYFYAVDAKTGNVIWKLYTGKMVRSSPILDVVREVIIFGSREGKVYYIKLARKGAKLGKEKPSKRRRFRAF